MMLFMCVLMEQKCILDVAKLKHPPTGNKLSDFVSYERNLEIDTPHSTVLRFTVGYIVFSSSKLVCSIFCATGRC